MMRGFPMEKIHKGYIAFIAMTILACLTILSACGPDQATPTPIAAASATPAQAGLGVDATLVPFPTLPISLATQTPTAAENATPVVTTPEAEATPTEQVEPQMVADMGFLPKPDGYSFENYAGKKKNGKPVPELFLADLLKMFGDADVCIQVVNGKCTP